MDIKAAEGRLFTFGDDPARQMSVFLTGKHKRAFLVVGGVVDSFFSLHSMRLLTTELDKQGWCTVQWQPASSMAGYGARTHVGDAEDLQTLIEVLEHDFDVSEICVFAWSSGVQVVLEYLATGNNAEIVTRVVLQGVVNDPCEEMFQAAGVARRQAVVDEFMASGKRDCLVPESVYDIPMTAARLSTGGLPSLQEALWQPATAGDHESLKSNLAPITVPLMILVASSTEYRPTAEALTQVKDLVRGCAATPEVEFNFFDAAGDERRRMLRGSEAEHTAAVCFFLRECDRRRDEREEARRQAQAEEMRRSRSILAKSALQGNK